MVVLAALGAGSLLVNAVQLAYHGIRVGGDTSRYLTAAHNLGAGRPMSDYSTLFHSGYVALLVLSDAVGAGPAGVVGLQFALAALAALVLFALGHELGGPVAGTMAALFFVVDLDLAMWHVYLLSDPLYTSLVIVTTCLVHRAVGRRASAYVLAAAAVAATASLRPNGYLFVPVAPIYWVSRAGIGLRTKIAVASLVI